jgi:hypothetical protein
MNPAERRASREGRPWPPREPSQRQLAAYDARVSARHDQEQREAAALRSQGWTEEQIRVQQAANRVPITLGEFLP